MEDCIKVIQGLSVDFKIWGQIISGGAFLKLLMNNENVLKHSARQSKLALNTP